MLRRHHTDYSLNGVTYCATWWQLGRRIFRHRQAVIPQ
jgi:hypothetical protein